MTKEEARTLLDAVKEGLDVDDREITIALCKTGDIGPRWTPTPKQVLASRVAEAMA